MSAPSGVPPAAPAAGGGGGGCGCGAPARGRCCRRCRCCRPALLVPLGRLGRPLSLLTRRRRRRRRGSSARALPPPLAQRAPHPPRQHVRDQQAEEQREQGVGRAQGQHARGPGGGRGGGGWLRLLRLLPPVSGRCRPCCSRRQRAEPLRVALGDAPPRRFALGLRELVPVGYASDVAVRADHGRAELDELDALASCFFVCLFFLAGGGGV